ncbi:hypothetical protein VQ643_01705 [Pseudomonas sp. F1_0610]|uniref:hypothetical protein n=1 Tax=Pseudomonas sp. F1_0610 TaxID=3114284 RepID=UPI0039C0E275
MRILVFLWVIFLSGYSYSSVYDEVLLYTKSASDYSIIYKSATGHVFRDIYVSGELYKKSIPLNLYALSNLQSSARHDALNSSSAYASFVASEKPLASLYFINANNRLEKVSLDNFVSREVSSEIFSASSLLKIKDIYLDDAWKKILFIFSNDRLSAYDISGGKFNLIWKKSVRLNTIKIEIIETLNKQPYVVTSETNELKFYSLTSTANEFALTVSDAASVGIPLFKYNSYKLVSGLYVSSSNGDVWFFDLARFSNPRKVYSSLVTRLDLVGIVPHPSGVGEILTISYKEQDHNLKLMGIWDNGQDFVRDLNIKNLASIEEKNYSVGGNRYSVYITPLIDSFDWQKYLGWKLNLGALSVNKIVGVKLIGKLLLISYEKNIGKSNYVLLLLDPNTGNSPDFVVLDLNKDGHFSELDWFDGQAIIALETNRSSILISPDARLHIAPGSAIRIQVDPRHNRRHTWYVMPPELVP